MNSTPEEITMSNTCTICLEELGERNITTLDCGHSFHYRCIFQWNAQHNSCPFCRQVIDPNNEEDNDFDGANADGPEIINMIDNLEELNVPIPNIIIPNNYEINNNLNNNHNVNHNHNHHNNVNHNHNVNRDYNDGGDEPRNEPQMQFFQNDVDNLLNIINDIINNIQDENNSFRQNLEVIRDFMPHFENGAIGLQRYCFDCNSEIIHCECCNELMCNCNNPDHIHGVNPFYHENINMDRTCINCFHNRDAFLTSYLANNLHRNLDFWNDNFLSEHYNNYYVNHSGVNINYRDFPNYDEFVEYVREIINEYGLGNVNNNRNQNNNQNNINNMNDVMDVDVIDVMDYVLGLNNHNHNHNYNYNYMNVQNNIYDNMVS